MKRRFSVLLLIITSILVSSLEIPIINDNSGGIIVVHTVDGQIHGLDSTTGALKWQFSSGDPLLIASSSLESSSSSTLIPSIDGSIYIVTKEARENDDDDDIRVVPEYVKTSFTAKDLVTSSPFVAENGLLFQGQKQTRVYYVDKNSGETLRVIHNSENQAPFELSTTSHLVIGRTDYIIQAYDINTGTERFNLTYGEMSVLFDEEVDDDSSSTSVVNDIYLTNEAGVIERLHGVTKNPIWAHQLPAPVTGVFDQQSQVIRTLSTSTSSSDDTTQLSVYVGQLPNKQKFIYESSSSSSSNQFLSLPSPYDNDNNNGRKCNDMDDFSCILQLNHKKITNEDENVCKLNETSSTTSTITTTIPTLNLQLLGVLVISTIILLLKFLVGQSRKTVIKDGVSYVAVNRNPNFLLNPLKVLGTGSHGTIVYAGLVDNYRPVAIKRLLKEFLTNADVEKKLLIHTDGHSNVLRFYCQEQCGDFVYLALEKCDGALATYDDDISDTRDFLLQLANGVSHLHSLQVTHRDLNPSNILIKNGQPKVADMGLGRISSTTNTSNTSTSSTIIGTVGYQAPEVLLKKSKPTTASDIFSLGCIFYYVLNKKKHPFGSNEISSSVHEIESNIMKGNYVNLLNEDDDNSVSPLAIDLVRHMVHVNPLKRWDITRVISHPFFYSCDQTIGFLMNVSDFIESTSNDDDQQQQQQHLERSLEYNAYKVIGGSSWFKNLDVSLLQEMEIFRSYRERSIKDLLRLIRNKKHHFHELPLEVQDILTGDKQHHESIVLYFTQRFPRLVLHCHKWLLWNYDSSTALQKHFSLKWKNIEKKTAVSSVASPPAPGFYPSKEYWVQYQQQPTRNSTTRRPLNAVLVDEKARTSLCSNWQESNGTSCAFGDPCHFAHGYVEFRLSYSRLKFPWTDTETGAVRDVIGVFSKGEVEIELQAIADEKLAAAHKTRVCRFYISQHGCTNGDNCRFIHPGVDDSTVTLSSEAIKEAQVIANRKKRGKNNRNKRQDEEVVSWPRNCTK